MRQVPPTQLANQLSREDSKDRENEKDGATQQEEGWHGASRAMDRRMRRSVTLFFE